MEKSIRLILSLDVFPESDMRQLDSLLTQDCPENAQIEIHLSARVSDRNVNHLIDCINRHRKAGNFVRVQILRDEADETRLCQESAVVLPQNFCFSKPGDLQTMLASGLSPQAWLAENGRALPAVRPARARRESFRVKAVDRVLEVERHRLFLTFNALYINADFCWAALLLLCYAAVTRLAPGAYLLPPWLLLAIACGFLLCGVSRLALRFLQVMHRRLHS